MAEIVQPQPKVEKVQYNAGDFYPLNTIRKHYINRNYQLEDIVAVAEAHYGRTSAYDILYQYYRGDHRSIIERRFEDPSKPNNKVVHNYPKLLVDTSTSYLVGEPVTLKGHEKTIKAMLPILNQNNFHDLDSELVKMSGIYGHSFEIHYINGDGEYRIKAVSPRNCLIAYSMDLEEEPLVAIYYNTITNDITGVTTFNYEVFTKDEVLKFSSEREAKKGADMRQVPPRISEPRRFPNLMGQLNVCELVANEERLGDFEAQIPLIDAYNQVVSDSVNDIAYWNDAYLWLAGFDVDNEDISDLKQNRVMITDSEGKVAFVNKQVNDKHVENTKVRLKQDIFTFSQTPDLASKDFDAATSTAMKAATQPLENKSAVKETKLQKLMKFRFESICHYLTNIKNVKGLKPDKVDPVFVRNLPQSFSELADMAVKLRDILPDETIIRQFPFITDAESEVEKANKQRYDRMMINAEVAAFNQTSAATVSGTSTGVDGKTTKLDNRTDKTAITTDDPVAAKEQDKARQKTSKER